jgi:CHAT domain-containing protein
VDTTPHGRRYALDEALITYAPSAAAHRASRRRAAAANSGSVLVVAPDHAGDLPHTRDEAELVRRSLPAGRVLAGGAASLPAVEAALPDHQVLHFACHGRYAPFAPLDSGLVLAGAEALTLRRLLALRLPEVRLTVLSACQTAVPSVDVIDEALGLPVGLLVAGAAGVIGTSWLIPDVGAMLVTARFYTTWTSGDGNAPAALRAAQQWVRDSTNADLRDAFPQLYESLALPPGTEAFWAAARPFAAPLYWASFSYIGS